MWDRHMASLVAQTVKRLPTMQETWVWSLGWEDPLEKEMATHSSILAWKIPWMEKSGSLQSMGSQRVRHDWVTWLSFFPILWSPDAKRQLIRKRPWYWERSKARGEMEGRLLDGWMAPPTQWTWVWVNSRSWWWTGRPGVLQYMCSQRVRHDWVTEQQQMWDLICFQKPLP